MIVKVKRADGYTEVHTTDHYTLSTKRELHPIILSAEVYTDAGVKVAVVKRPFAFFYRRFVFKTEMVQEQNTETEEVLTPPDPAA